MKLWAIYFNREFKPGEHWETDRSKIQESDLKQHWKIGDLYSTGTVATDTLPPHLSKKEVEYEEGMVWDSSSLNFYKP